jgi:POT family proton-dependent oligopeptide transporter
MSPLLCGYIGETYGWHYGFGLATIGMLVGLAVFVMPNLITQALISAAALAASICLVFFAPDNVWALSINVFIALALVTAAVIACVALKKGGLPEAAGAPPAGRRASKDWMVYVGIAVAVAVFAVLVSGFSPFRTPQQADVTESEAETVAWLKKYEVQDEHIDAARTAGNLVTVTKARGKSYQLIGAEAIAEFKAGVPAEVLDELRTKGINSETIDAVRAGAMDTATIATLEQNGVSQEAIATITDGGGAMRAIVAVFASEVSKPAGLVLTVLGIIAFGFLIIETFRLEKIAKERMLAALILIFFQMLFFAFFEQAGSSLNNFTDRNVDRVAEEQTVTADMVGQTIRLQPTQEQMGFERDASLFSQSELDKLRKVLDKTPNFDISWPVAADNVGMGISARVNELPASIFQSVNPTYILIFALLFNVLWSYLRKLKLDPSAPVKFGLGLAQLGLGFGAFWMGAQAADERGMVTLTWLFIGYLLQTTGELCLSPVGLSVMTKLAPRVLVSTLMGAWFLATAFSQYLAAIISQFTGIEDGSGGDLPAPIDTVNVYGDVFGQIAITAIISGVICWCVSPLLKHWMHEDVDVQSDA